MNKDTPIFVTVGRIASPKNPIFIIELMHEILMRKKNVKLMWIGTGNLESEVKQEVKKREIYESIDFLGIQDNVNKFLNEADYFLLPSLYEGFSLALAEAQAVGLNCFVSDTVSKLSDCGGCIFLPLEKDAKYWANEICNYIDSRTYQQIDEKKLKKFDIKEMANALEQIYIR